MKTPTTTTMPLSNATNTGLAAYLAESNSGCTFTSLVITKVGITRGRGAAKKVYGDDTVQVTLVTGFSYPNLLERDMVSVREVSAKQLLAAVQKSGKLDKDGNVPSLDDCKTALDKVEIAIQKSIANENISTTDHVREPLVVVQNGVRTVVKGAWVNNGTVDPSKKGNVNILALKISEVVLEAAPNGPIPTAKSQGYVVARKVLEDVYLRCSRIKSYKLTPSQEFYLKVGGDAIAEVVGNGINEITDKMTVRAAWELGQVA